MENPGKKDLKELYESWIDDDLASMRFISIENKVFQRIRENYQDDWETIELCRELIWYNFNQISFLKERIEDVTNKLKKLI